MPEHNKEVAILYHGGCPDGFGAAYAAWKKFGDSADYIPVRYNEPIPKHIEGMTVYMIDFCYPKETMDQLSALAQSVTVLDHHEGVREVVESMPSHVYDAERSGASIAWNYFHPDTALPTFLKYVQDADLFKMLPDDARAIISYTYAQPWHFDTWDAFVRNVDDPAERAKMVERGSVYQEYFKLLSHQLANSAELVLFEGYECYLAAAEKMFVTDVGDQLRTKRPPLALIARVGATGLRVSIRSDDSVNAAVLAQKYGGNGHPKSAAFSLPWGAPIPWTPVTPTKES
jgi:oligoribonuclease NrnB/cAMP/cGMP phosphodiesterase (DHH superfamily)